MFRERPPLLRYCSALRERTLPQDRDVVVTRESRSRIIFTIRQLPGDVQLSASSRDDAIRLARGFATKNGVDVWYSEGETLRLLEAYRRNQQQTAGRFWLRPERRRQLSR
jgi:hypothetical protein